MARTDKRKGRVKYSRKAADLADDLRRARYGRFWNHPALESVLICENYEGILGTTPLDAITPSEFDRWLRSVRNRHEKIVLSFKKKSPTEYGEMLDAIQQAEDAGPDPRFRIAWEQYSLRALAQEGFRFLPAHHFQSHLQRVSPKHFPPTETVESFMMFAKRAGLRFVGPKNSKRRRTPKRSK